jgi:hypothetical protein
MCDAVIRDRATRTLFSIASRIVDERARHRAENHRAIRDES